MRMTRHMTDVVTVAAVSGVSASGDPTFSAQRTIKARVEQRVRNERFVDKSERISDTVVLTHDTIRVGERCWLPGTDTGSADEAREVLRVNAGASLVDGTTLYEAEV